jgi:hypothetical protein
VPERDGRVTCAGNTKAIKHGPNEGEQMPRMPSMLMTGIGHVWRENILAPARLDQKRSRPKVNWWPKCVNCEAQVCQNGYGQKAQLFYRASAYQEWTEKIPSCRCSTRGALEKK